MTENVELPANYRWRITHVRTQNGNLRVELFRRTFKFGPYERWTKLAGMVPYTSTGPKDPVEDVAWAKRTLWEREVARCDG